jgi:Cd2+/Zn2+-exporting ATPase
MGKSCCGDMDSKETKENSVAPEGSKETIFKLRGLDCADEVAALKRSLVHPSIFKFDANIMDESVKVYHRPELNTQEIVRLIEKAGLKVVDSVELSFLAGHKKQIYLISSSGIILIIGMILEWFTETPDSVRLPIFLISIGLSGYLVFPKAIRALRDLSLDMNVLMSIAVVGALLIREYSEAATVVFLFAIAELLEALSVTRARKAIRDVLKITPKFAKVITSEGTIEKDVNEIAVGETVLIRPGESVPLDGIVIEGSSSFNQSALTGESIPVEKSKGDTVLAGTLNGLGAVKVEVTAAFRDTKVSKIISLIESAQNEKAPSQRFVDSFAKIYTPAILVLALIVAFIVPIVFNADFNVWIYRSLVLLVIGCPCALVIATPVSVVSGLTSLARRGVLVKGGVFLEALGQIRAIAVDKTGTITEGEPRVLGVKNFSSIDEKELIRITASLENMTTHPLASAVIEYAKAKNISPGKVEEFQHVNGRGGKGLFEGHWYFVGNHAFAHELGVCTPELEQYLSSVELDGRSVIIAGHMNHDGHLGEILTVFSVGDEIKADSAKAIRELHEAGIKEVIMISGDNQKTAEAIAKKVGIDKARGDLLPDDKVREISELVAKYKHVGMIGDGVNDAPALAHASVGIAMGAAGSDVAIETADVALMRDELSELPKAILHGRRVLRVIRFNIGFAIFIKIIFFILAFLGYSNLWMAVAADMGASLFVTFNALRLLKIDGVKKARQDL